MTTEWYPHRASDAPDPEPDPLETLKSAGRMTIDVPSAEEVIEANERRRKLFAVNMRSLLYT